MIKKIFKSLGLMSGTSMDGVDAAIIETDGYKIHSQGPSHFLPYPEEFRQRLRSILGQVEYSNEIKAIEQELTQFHIQAIEELGKNYPLSALDVIGFHGHTITHLPNQKLTWQIGDAQMLQNHFNIQVMHDFRNVDMSRGGQGAPLVPVYHFALKKPNSATAIVNIGGISNVTLMPSDFEEEMIAFDLGPGNALIDDYVLQHFDMAYDKGGEIAKSGQVRHELLESFFAQDFFKRQPPKSLDRLDLKIPQEILSLNHKKDAVSTLTYLTAHSIYQGLTMKGMPRVERVYLTGGGRHNQAISSFFADLCQDKSILIDKVEALGVNGDFVEAQAFGFLAVRVALGLPISYEKTTGARASL